jgi:bacterioferritin-associated ferredoxin
MTGRNHEILKAIQRAVSTLALVASPASLGAQSCAMCYQSAAASGSRTIHALNAGILILMFPPALITLGIFYLGYKKRNTFNESE